MTRADATGAHAPKTTGALIHAALGYDLLVGLLTFGRERAFREKLVDLATLASGERVLDVGCGTGSLAIAAKRRVGVTGIVSGIDASPTMIARAKHKARKARLEIDLRTAIIEALPFPDAAFDIVLSTMMLHHLPRKARADGAREMQRVLKPGGRVLAVDFGRPKRPGLIAHLHRHSYLEMRDLVELLTGAGLAIERTGDVGIKNLQFAVARRPRT